MRCRISYKLNTLKFNPGHFVIFVLRENILQMYFPEQDIEIEDVLYILCTLNVASAQHYSYLPLFFPI